MNKENEEKDTQEDIKENSEDTEKDPSLDILNAELPAPPDVQNFRSMRFDIADAAKEDTVSLSEIALAAQKRKRHGFEWEEQEARDRTTRKIYATTSAIIMIAAIVIIGTQLARVISERANNPDSDVPSIVSADGQLEINLDERVGNTTHYDTLTVLHSTHIAERGDIVHIYFRVNPTQEDIENGVEIVVAPISRVVEEFNLGMPSLLSRTIDRSRYMYGWYAQSADSFKPYFAARVINEDSALAAMLNWEGTMTSNLQQFFFLQDTARGRLFSNKRSQDWDLRILTTKGGEPVLVYGIQDSKLIIATDEDVLFEIAKHVDQTLP